MIAEMGPMGIPSLNDDKLNLVPSVLSETPLTLVLNEHSGKAGAEKSKKIKGWLNTIRNVAVLEGLPHLGGGLAANFGNIIVSSNSTPELAVIDGVIAAGMYTLMFGPITNSNVRYVVEDNASITFSAKIAQAFSRHKQKDEESTRKLAKFAHITEQTLWEALYLGEAAGVGLGLGTNAGLKYWGGAAAVGLVKNVALYSTFKFRERHTARKARKDSAQIASNEEEIKDFPGKVIDLFEGKK